MPSIDSKKYQLENFCQDMPYLVIEKTAERLEGMNFSPTLLFDVENFLRLSRRQMIEQLELVEGYKQKDLIKEGMPETENGQTFKEKQIQLMVYWFKLLCRLRRDEPEAWDEINELYEDD